MWSVIFNIIIEVCIINVENSFGPGTAEGTKKMYTTHCSRPEIKKQTADTLTLQQTSINIKPRLKYNAQNIFETTPSL
jgi:hypothetical protein